MAIKKKKKFLRTEQNRVIGKEKSKKREKKKQKSFEFFKIA